MEPIVISKFTEIRKELLHYIEIEEKKYPLTDREKILTDTILNILKVLEWSR